MVSGLCIVYLLSRLLIGCFKARNLVRLQSGFLDGSAVIIFYLHIQRIVIWLLFCVCVCVCGGVLYCRQITGSVQTSKFSFCTFLGL